MKYLFLSLSLTAVVLVGDAGPATAQPPGQKKARTISEVVDELCDFVSRHLKSQNQSNLKVQLPAVDPGIYSAQGIYEELLKGLQAPARQVRVENRAAYKLTTTIEESAARPAFLNLKAQLIGPDGEAVTFERDGKNTTNLGGPVTSPVSVSQGLGYTADLLTAVPAENRLAVLQQLSATGFFHDPKDHWVAPRPNSLYFVRLVDPQGRPYPVVDKDGKPFLALPKGATYQIEIRNNHPTADAAAEITIDGISVFRLADPEFLDPQTQSPRFRQYIVASKGVSRIKGWFQNMERSKEFLVTDHANSVAGSLKHPAENIGVITVCFSAAWEVGKNPPADEGQIGMGEGGTGAGADIEEKKVAVKREIGKLRTTISLHYDLKPAI